MTELYLKVLFMMVTFLPLIAIKAIELADKMDRIKEEKRIKDILYEMYLDGKLYEKEEES